MLDLINAVTAPKTNSNKARLIAKPSQSGCIKPNCINIDDKINIDEKAMNNKYDHRFFINMLIDAPIPNTE